MSLISVLCPVQRVLVYANSQRLDDMGQFTKYVLWAVGEGYSAQEIADAIELKSYIVQDEVLYLTRIGFVSEVDCGYKLTETGKGYLELISVVNDFNKDSIIAQLNWFTGAVSDWNPNVEKNVHHNDVDLPYRVSRYLILNKDYAPLKEFVWKAYSERFDSLRKELADSIYFFLEPFYQDGKLYRRYYLEEIPPADVQYETINEPMVLLERAYATVQLKYYDERLLHYKTVADTLTRLNDFESLLLSDYAKRILRWIEYERSLNQMKKKAYFDLSRGEEIDTIPAEIDATLQNLMKKTVKLPSVNISDISSLKDDLIVESEEGTVYFAKEITKYTIERRHQLIPFALLKEEK